MQSYANAGRTEDACIFTEIKLLLSPISGPMYEKEGRKNRGEEK